MDRSDIERQRRKEVEEAKLRRCRILARQLGRDLTSEERRREEQQIERTRETMDRLNWR